jgi:hypothetical protein
MAAGGGTIVDSSILCCGTSTTCWHFGQRAFLPAYFASTLNFVWQAEQRQRISMTMLHAQRRKRGLHDPSLSTNVSP